MQLQIHNLTLRSRRPKGLTLIELMVAMTISMVVLSSLVALFVNTSRNNTELAKTNNLIEDGRVAVELLGEDIVHAGYWGGYLPQFDDLTATAGPIDAPTAIPNPCTDYNTWDETYRTNLIGIPLQTNDALPAGVGCISPLAQRANTDVLVIRHADTCVPGVGNCTADIAGSVYFQAPQCGTESDSTAQTATSNTITLASSASSINNAYRNAIIRTLVGPGAGQHRLITAYDGTTKVATLNTAWTTTPGSTTSYSLDFKLGNGQFLLQQRDCTTVTSKRKFISNIYYITDINQNGTVIPTLVRSQFDRFSGVRAQQAPVELVGGVENLRVELGIDNLSDTGAAVDYTVAVNWADPMNKVSPTNRGDGVADTFIRCTTAIPCSVAELSNVVAVKLYILARNRETTAGYTDTKSYCLGSPNPDGSCPADSTIAAANDNYKRHVFTTSVRLTNIAGRRETP